MLITATSKEFIQSLQEIVKILDVVAIVQLLVFAFLLVKKKEINNRILAAILFVFSVCLMDRLFFHYRFVLYTYFPHTLLIGDTFHFLYLPLIYFYTLSVTNKNFRFRKIYFLHFVPFLYYFLIVFLNYTVEDTETKRQIIRSLSEPKAFTSTGYSDSIHNFIALAQKLYIVFAVAVLAGFRKQLKFYNPGIRFKGHSGLSKILVSYLIFVVVTHIPPIPELFERMTLDQVPFLDIAIIVYSLLFVVYGLRYGQLDFSGFPDFTPQKYEKLSGDQAIIARLKYHLEKNEPYLDSQLTLDKLACELSIPSRKLSEIINGTYQKNFFDFINCYRIDRAKKLIAKNIEHDPKVLDVLFESGFSSKSAFNRAFRKYTGMSPSEYKASLR